MNPTNNNSELQEVTSEKAESAVTSVSTLADLQKQKKFCKMELILECFFRIYIWTHCAGDIIVGSVMFSERERDHNNSPRLSPKDSITDRRMIYRLFIMRSTVICFFNWTKIWQLTVIALKLFGLIVRNIVSISFYWLSNCISYLFNDEKTPFIFLF